MARPASGSGSRPTRRRRNAVAPPTQASAQPLPTYLAPASTFSSSGDAPPVGNVPDTSSVSRYQDVTTASHPIYQGPMMDNDQINPAFRDSLLAANVEDNLMDAIRGLLLMSYTTPATFPSQGDTTSSSTAQQVPSSSTRAVRKDKGVKRRKLDNDEPQNPPFAPVGGLPLRSFQSRQVISGRAAVCQFNIFEAILRHENIFFNFITCLDVDTLVSVYAISKEIHNMINSHNTALILAQAMRYAPQSASIFLFRCYRKLCNDDPRVDLDLTRGQSRLIPSFRWLRMIHWREQIAHQIVSLLNAEGLYLPAEAETAVKKLWFLMDIPDNERRLATIQNPDLWTTADLFYACMFFMRVDMRCTDPLLPQAHANIRRMLMAQPSMAMLCRVLERKFLVDKHEAMQTYMRWKFTAEHGQLQERTLNLFGVPRRELGLLQFEGYGKEGSRIKLQRPDELVLKECVRREMDMETAFFCMLNYVSPRPTNAAATANAHAHAHAHAFASATTSANAAGEDDDATMVMDEAD